MKYPRTILFFKLLILSLFWVACGNDDDAATENPDETYSINLSVEKIGREIMLNWEKANFSDFENYFILRSTEPIPNAPGPTNPIDSIQDFQTNQYNDDAFPLTGKVYYKLYVQLGENYLESENVSIEFFDEIYPFTSSVVTHDEGNDLLFILDILQYKIFRFDMKNKINTDSLELEPGGYKFKVGDAGMGPELFITKIGTGILQIYDAANFNYKNEMNAIGEIQDMAIGNGAFILAANQSGESLTIYDRSTLDRINGSNFVNHFDRRLKLINTDSIILIDFNDDELAKYVFDENWEIISEKSIPRFSDALLEIVCSPDGQYFIPNIEGDIYNHDLEKFETSVTDVPQSLNFFSDFVFVEKTDELFGFINNNFFMSRFSFPDMEHLENISLSYHPFRAFRMTDGNVMVVGRLVDFQPERTYFDLFEF